MRIENNIPEGWVEGNLESVIDLIIDHRGKTPKKLGGDWSTEGYRAVSAKTIKNGKLVNEDKMNILPKELYDKWMKNEIEFGDVLLTSEAPLGEHMIWKSKEKIVLSQRIFGIRTDSKILNSGYFNYFIDGRFFQHELKSRESGSTVTGIKQSELLKTKVAFPPLPEQKAIAKVLTAFDDKIELLQAQNKTLETMAQTIFKEWFGKYQIGDELPEGWRVGKLGDIAKHVKNNIKPFDNPNKLYHHYSLPAYDDGLRPVNELGSDIKSNKYSVENNSFLVSKLNPFTPRIWTIFNSEDVNICSTEFQVVKPNEDNLFSIVHCLLNSKYFTDNLSQKIKGTSSSHQRVNPEDIFEVDLVIPNKEDLIRFEKLVIPMITKKDINHNNIQSLTKTRDTLLPKLMSGQVRVNNIKQTADA